MKSLLIASCVLAVVAAETCTPGSLFQKSCNWCRCLSDGKSLACTDKLCPENNSAVKQVCAPKSTFKVACNVCRCSNDGTDFACTKMLCDEDAPNEDATLRAKEQHEAARSVEKQVCTPNSHFKEYCNSCVCSKDGLSKFCTMRLCGDNYNKNGGLKKQNSAKSPICTPNSYFKESCNFCTCSKDGLFKFCTMMNCGDNDSKVDLKQWGPEYKQGDACVPGSVFYSQCNRCVCFNSGDRAACTFMDC